MKINNPASYQFSHAKLTVFRVFFLSCFCTATVSRDCCFYTPHTHAGHTKMFGCFPAGDGLTVACHVNRLDVFKDWGPPNCSFSPQNSTRCLMKASVCVRMVCVCVYCMSVCVCNHFHLCADTTPCVEANGCRLATPFLHVSLPFVLLPSRHISAAFTSPHPSLFLFLCPILSFYYLHHFDTLPTTTTAVAYMRN